MSELHNFQRVLERLAREIERPGARWATPNLPTNIVNFRGFDSSIISNSRGGILMSIGDFLESLSQGILVGCNGSREIGRKHPVSRCRPAVGSAA